MSKTISELLARGKLATNQFRVGLGYDTAELDFVRISGDGRITYNFTLMDNFQNELSYDKRYCAGYSESLSDEGFNDDLDRWPNREQRELYILAAQVAPLTKMAEEIRSAQVKAFVARLQPDIDDLRRQLTHKK